MYKSVLVCISVFGLTAGFACEGPHVQDVSYPLAVNQFEADVDAHLTNAEMCLFANQFDEAFRNVENAEGLLHLTHQENDQRKLRIMFDKAVIVTCIEGPTDNSYAHFAAVNSLLLAKRCSNTSSQPNLFDQNGHWPILGDSSSISVNECLERVGSTTKYLEIASMVLKVHPATRMTIATAIYTISQQARGCCTQEGFWKTCIQPVVDAWKRAELLGIPPDPYWD